MGQQQKWMKYLCKNAQNTNMKQTLKYIYQSLFENLKYAETKHSITMTIASAVIAFASTYFSNNKLINILASATIMLALISIIYSFVALLSRNVKLPKKDSHIEDTNLMSYRTISKYTDIGYVKKIKKDYKLPANYIIDEMDLDLAREVISIAKLVSIKFSYFNFALFFLFLSILCTIVAVCIRGNLI